MVQNIRRIHGRTEHLRERNIEHEKKEPTIRVGALVSGGIAPATLWARPGQYSLSVVLANLCWPASCHPLPCAATWRHTPCGRHYGVATARS